MSKLMDRVKSRREAERRGRAISRAMRDAHSPSLRRELMEIVSRYEINQVTR